MRTSEPEKRDVVPVLAELKRALRAEIKRRGLWETSPTYLGVYGAERWEPGSSGRGGALEELLADCFSYIFVDRLRSLGAQLRVKPDIEGLVYLNVRHFVHERQRDCDPLGARVFQVLHRALRAAVEEGDLAVLAGDPRIRNETMLTFNSGGEDVPVQDRAERVAHRVARWCDDLLPDLVTATGRKEDPLVERLRVRLVELWDEGFDVFSFQELIDPLKAEVRGRWATILGSGRERLGVAGPAPASAGDGTAWGDRAKTADAIEPASDLLLEQRDGFRALVACVVRAVARMPGDERSRRPVERLWGYLRIWAKEGGLVGDRLPSNRELSVLLGLPRERIPGAMDVLRRLIDACRGSRADIADRDWNRPETPRPGSH